MQVAKEKKRSFLRTEGPIILDNRACAYCGYEFDGDVPVTRDHLVARRFVPKGTMANQWNLLINACPRCNVEKSDLEGEISAASMLPWPGVVSSDAARREWLRKAKGQMSSDTGRPIVDSAIRRDIDVELGPSTTATFNIVGPPQVDGARIERLAGFHLTGLFYLLTWSEEKRVGRRWIGSFGLCCWSRRTDWGNVSFQGFTSLSRTWDVRAVLRSGAEHFKMMLRRHPDQLVWAWALEWNQNFRCVGFLGDDQHVLASMDQVPVPQAREIKRDGDWVLTVREEVPLSEGDDLLFLT